MTTLKNINYQHSTSFYASIPFKAAICNLKQKITWNDEYIYLADGSLIKIYKILKSFFMPAQRQQTPANQLKHFYMSRSQHFSLRRGASLEALIIHKWQRLVAEKKLKIRSQSIREQN